MDDMKDKVKGLMKKVNNPFSSSNSGKFKGQGRVLGSTSSGPVNPIPARYSHPQHNPPPNPSSSSASSASSSSSSSSVASAHSKPLPQKPLNSERDKPRSTNSPDPDRKPADGFDPYDSLITSGKRSQHGYSLNVFECPVCGSSYGSEEDVSEHVESCLDNKSAGKTGDADVSKSADDGSETKTELEFCVSAFVSGNPPKDSGDVIPRLLRNIVKEPENAKFRKIRMSNPKIREAIGEVGGAVELLEFLGFALKEEGGEIYAMMESPSEKEISLINKAIALLEPRKKEEETKKSENFPSAAPADREEVVQPKKADRQVRVFFAVPENVAAKIRLPDSFYNLSAQELKREAEMRKKKIADSQLLIPKSYKEKQAKAARKKYTKTVIRVQFPDGVVLQGIFFPWEPTSAIYEFVSSALKEPSLEFELLDPVLVKRRVIPHFPERREKARTLDDEDLVPAALIKFRPVESDFVAFTGLTNELVEIIEPLDSAAVRM